MPVTPDPIDLTTLAKVRSFMQHDATVALDNDDEMQRLITRASATIMDYTGREFVSAATAGTARQFLYYSSPDHVMRTTPFDLRSVTAVTFDPESSSPTALVATDWRLLPIPSKYGVFNSLYFPRHSGNAAGRIVQVTGTWGWATVPHEVEQACIDTVDHWIKRNLPGGEAIPEERDRYGPVLFPTSARMTLRRYRLVPV
ncbi:MAG: hypothetical protein H7123_00430 [Thermoleophilia bacterium]|nr:hypothetical protein [Thermoleophilia bacterium]